MQEGETPNEATLTTDHEDYPPYSYVYFSGTGFEPGETVNMIVVRIRPQSYSRTNRGTWSPTRTAISIRAGTYSPEELIGATMQVTATGQTSGLTASATFTDSAAPVLYEDSRRTN